MLLATPSHKIDSSEEGRWTLPRAVRSAKIRLPTCWLAPDTPVRRTNQNRLVGPSIVTTPQFSAAWKAQWHNAGLIKFANFQIAIFRREFQVMIDR
jgi:hypothetical protein